jgi:AraC-like DNA-binding protein
MKTLTFLPCDILKPFVKSFVVSEVEKEGSYKVLPDTGLVIGFQYKGRLYRIEGNKSSALANAGITGLADVSRIFHNSDNIGTVLVFFREAGAYQFFRQPLHELFKESVSLDNFMLRSELLFLEEELAEAKTDDKRISAVERFLIARMKNSEPDKLVLAALALIHKTKGNIRISELMDQLHISQSPLEKRFRQVVGTSPKKFASIVRMKNAVQQYNSKSSLTELSHEAGFYDQAHFIKEFKTFTGETPEKFFSGKK